MDDAEFLNYNNYLRKQAKINSKFATKKAFSISDEEIKLCKDIIKEIDIRNDKISKTTKSDERNLFNREKGKLLEQLAQTIFYSADIYEMKTNIRDNSNEIDVLLMPSDYNKINEVLLPEYLKDDILVECKNYNKNIKVDWVGKFSSLATMHKVTFGIIFSYNDFAGSGWSSSKGLSKKIFLAENKAIININLEDINTILNKEVNIVELIQNKYEALRHEVDYKKFITKHPAEVLI